MVGVGNQASSSSSKNTLRTICTSTKVEIVLLVPGIPGTTPSYAPDNMFSIWAVEQAVLHLILLAKSVMKVMSLELIQMENVWPWQNAYLTNPLLI